MSLRDRDAAQFRARSRGRGAAPASRRAGSAHRRAADRLSCSAYRANAFRRQLHALGYNLLLLFRQTLLADTELATSTLGTVRLRLLKVGARVRRSVRHLWFHCATGWPGQPRVLQVLTRLAKLRAPDG